MKRKHTLAIFVATLFWAFLSSSALCGVILHKQSYRLIPGKGGTQALKEWAEYYQGNKVAVYQNNAIFVTDMGTDTLINILPSRKIYAVNSFGNFIKRIQNIVNQIRSQPQYREPPPAKSSLKVKIKKTGKTKKILGYFSEQYMVFSNGKRVRELWLTVKLPLAKEADVDKEREEKARIEEVIAPLAGSRDVELTQEYQNLLKGGKVPMVITSYIDGTEEVERIVRVEIVAISKEVFEVPKGYKKVPIERFMQH